MQKKNLTEELSEKLGIPEERKCDNVLKWDGESLYVEDEVFRGAYLIRKEKRVVGPEIVARLKGLQSDA